MPLVARLRVAAIFIARLRIADWVVVAAVVASAFVGRVARADRAPRRTRDDADAGATASER